MSAPEEPGRSPVRTPPASDAALAQEPAGVGRHRGPLVLAICGLGLFMAYLDGTILNVALPTIQHEFHAGVAGLQWVLDAYQLTMASLLVFSGSLADRVGRRRVFRAGLLLFTLGSLLCSVAPGIGLLIAFRVVQALGGCILTPVSLSIVRQVFPDPAERARALGWWSAIFGLGVASGPLLGGVLVAQLDWRAVFWVNVPVGVGAWLLCGRYVPESRAARPRRQDPGGQLLVILGLASLTYALIEGPSSGWFSPRIIASFLVCVGSLVALLAVERRHPEPLFEMALFRSPMFCAANGIALLSFLVFSGFLFVNTLYLQRVRGESALLAGCAVAPATVTIMLIAPFAGRLVARHGPRLPLVLAGLCLSGGALILTGIAPNTPYWVLAVAYVLLGLGFGLLNPPITQAAISGMPPAQAGLAGAIASTARQVGNALGIAVMGSMISLNATEMGALSAQGGARFSLQTHLAWMLALGCGLVCTVAAVLGTGPRARRIALETYHERPSRASPRG